MVAIIIMFYYAIKNNSYEQDYDWLKEKSYNKRRLKEKDEAEWHLQ